jgi:hypothetical protein
MFAGGNDGWRPKPQVFSLTASERAELLNWACFDTLPSVLPTGLLCGDRYVNSPEFQPDDLDPLYRRMTRVLEDVPTGDPIALPNRLGTLRLLDESWFSDDICEQVARWGTGQMYLYQRARYLFVSHWLHQPQEALAKVVQQVTDYGLNHRYALSGLNFNGVRED